MRFKRSKGRQVLQVSIEKILAVMLNKHFSFRTSSQKLGHSSHTALGASGLGSEIVLTIEQLFSNLIREQAKVHVLIAVILDPNLLINTLIGEM